MTLRNWRKAIKQRADAEWDSIDSQVDPRLHAKQHLAEMSAEKRARIERDWI